MRINWLSFLAWDGFLPAASAAASMIMERLFPGLMSIIFLIPIANALIRCSIGADQIRQICSGELPTFRQLNLGLAIIALLLVEMAVQICCSVPRAIPHLWKFLVFMYISYLTLIALALRRASNAEEPSILPDEADASPIVD